jgi:hypothetical protein
MKPKTILINNNGDAMLYDYSITKITGREKTIAGSQFTLLYTPPEAFEEATPAPSWDVWNLGYVVYEMLTGWSPIFCTNRGRNFTKNYDVNARTSTYGVIWLGTSGHSTVEPSRCKTFTTSDDLSVTKSGRFSPS